MILAEIRIHPLKSAGAIVLESTELDRFGPVGDRRWMAVDSEGVFLSQRKTPELALVRPRLRGEKLELSREGMPTLTVARGGGSRRRVRVWKDELEAIDCGDEAADWLGRALGRPCRLVRLADGVRRRVGGDDGTGAPLAFADGHPLLLLSRASLADLNERLPVRRRRLGRPRPCRARAAALSRMRHPRARLRPCALRRLRPRLSDRVLLQGRRCLSVLQHAPHGRDGRPSR